MHLGDFEWPEIHEGLRQMCKEMDLSGSAADQYSIYEAVHREWKKARAARGGDSLLHVAEERADYDIEKG